MDRISSLQSLFVIGISAFRREFLMLRAIKVGEGTRDDVAIFKLNRIYHRLKQPPPNNLKSFFGTGRPPRRLNPADNVPKSIERLAPAYATDLHIVGLR